jgi:hypothetical protein
MLFFTDLLFLPLFMSKNPHKKPKKPKKPIKKPPKTPQKNQKTHKNKKGSQRLPKKGPRGPFLFTDRSADLQKIEYFNFKYQEIREKQ